MPRVRYDITVTKNDGLVVTSRDLIDKYFYGALPKRTDGTTMSENTIESFIRDSQASVEDNLSIVLQYQYVKENAFFEQRSFANWVFTKTTYPVDVPIRFDGYISSLRQIKYPSDWISKKYESSTRGDKGRHRRVNIVPGGTQSSPVSGSVIYAGIIPHLGVMNLGNIADYWRVAYLTGFTKIPDNIAAVVQKKAAITILSILGDIVLGAGVSGKTLSIDGLSQSVSSHKNDKYGAYGPRIQQFQKEVEAEMKVLHSLYRDMTLAVC